MGTRKEVLEMVGVSGQEAAQREAASKSQTGVQGLSRMVEDRMRMAMQAESVGSVISDEASRPKHYVEEKTETYRETDGPER